MPLFTVTADPRGCDRDIPKIPTIPKAEENSTLDYMCYQLFFTFGVSSAITSDCLKNNHEIFTIGSVTAVHGLLARASGQTLRVAPQKRTTPNMFGLIPWLMVCLLLSEASVLKYNNNQQELFVHLENIKILHQLLMTDCPDMFENQAIDRQRCLWQLPS